MSTLTGRTEKVTEVSRLSFEVLRLLKYMNPDAVLLADTQVIIITDILYGFLILDNLRYKLRTEKIIWNR